MKNNLNSIAFIDDKEDHLFSASRYPVLLVSKARIFKSKGLPFLMKIISFCGELWEQEVKRKIDNNNRVILLCVISIAVCNINKLFDKTYRLYNVKSKTVFRN